MLSRPLQVEWAGWRTDTFKLQAAGWSLSANQDVYERRMRIAMEHKQLQMRAISFGFDFDYFHIQNFRGHPDDYLSGLSIPMHVLGSEVHIHEQGTIDWAAFQPVDATPSFISHRIGKIQDFVHFAPAQVKTKELIVPQENVEELLAKILDMQNPARMERIRKEVRNPEGMTLNSIDELHGKQKFEAQIISIAA